ncbi:hypothetical protein PROFUN_03650 [Planoprotostelium fungivorum]|uniref:General stress protein FMN-binding split barrel domain-containing protein n=1 Tax=Planoprotostelium fungivorum TaxID=1890364 RepID=A0A2P6NSF6_9EUKA|nr:hypothetical protein PROFUN_03650 [Planoprotostelium fungivorum]
MATILRTRLTLAPRRSFVQQQITQSRRMTSHKTEDPYKAKATENLPDKKTQFDELYGIVDAIKTSMLTTRRSDGLLTSRAMNPTQRKGPDFTYFTNIHGDKTPEIQNDEHVNVSYVDPSSSNWVSVSGIAKISQDRNKIKELYSPATKAWFGDLEDGVHDGGPEDPRIALIEVKAHSINYWYSKGKLATVTEMVKGAITGETAAPGSLRFLSEQDVEEARKASR